MRRLLGGLFALACLGSMMVAGTAHAAVNSFSYSQTCSNGKANVNMQWQNVDPGAAELWVDLSTKQDFSDGLESRGPLGRVTNYAWDGLEPHSIYYVRVNQKLAGGAWDASGVGRVATACGTTPAAAGASFTLKGFSDQIGPRNAVPDALTAGGGTLKACNAPRLYVYLDYKGLDDLTDFIGTWTGPNLNRDFAWALPKGDGPAFFATAAPAAGYAPGIYGFKFRSGGDGAPQVHIDATVTLTC